MALYNFHRVLITAAILFDFFFTLYCIRDYLNRGGSLPIVMGVGSTVVALSLVAYLVHFNRNVAALRRLMTERSVQMGARL